MARSGIRRGINRFMIKYQDYFNGKRVLDFGSGKTKYYKHFFLYKDYVGLDKMIDGTDITEEMGIRGDCGLCIAVLEHSVDPVSALKNIKKCIGDGYLLLVVSIVYSLHLLPDDYYRFTTEFWRVVELCGFKVIDKEEINAKGLDMKDSCVLAMFCKGVG